MKILILSIYIFFFSYAGKAQIPSNFDSLKIYPFKKISWKQYNWRELRPITSLFKNNNIVVISDASHYEGGVKDAQSMILKGLIDSNLINTIYLEASWIDMNKIQSILKEKGRAGIEEVMKYFGSKALEYWLDDGFLNYLADQVKMGKIRLVGFDIAGTSSYRTYQMFKEAYEFPAVRKMITSAPYELKIIRDQYLFFNFEQKPTLRFPKDNLDLQKAFIDVVKNEYSGVKDTVRYKEWERMLNFFEWHYKSQFYIKDISKEDIELDADLIISSKYHAYRDSMMSEILKEDYKSFGNVKAVAIMGGYHTLSNFKESENIEKYIVANGVETLVSLLKKGLDSITAISFISSSGSFGVYNDGKKQFEHKIKVYKTSIEEYYQNDPRDFFYIDLQKYPASESFISSLLFKRPFLAQWAKIYQGLFYIKNMYPIQLKIHPGIITPIDDTVDKDIIEAQHK